MFFKVLLVLLICAVTSVSQIYLCQLIYENAVGILRRRNVEGILCNT